MEEYLSGRDLYEAHSEEVRRLLGDELPFWEELSAVDQDDWQADADELNEARLGPPEGLDPVWL